MISLLIFLLLIIFNSLNFIYVADYINIRLLILSIMMMVLYFLPITVQKLRSFFASKKYKKAKNIQYTDRIMNGICFRRSTSLEEDLLPSFNENLIEYKIENLSLFEEEDLKIVELFLEKQEKLHARNIQYANKFLATIISFTIILIPNIVIRTLFLVVFWGFFHLFEYFIEKDSITSRSFVCVQILKEAQIRRSKLTKLKNKS